MYVIKSKARITAIGSYVPEQVLTNYDLEKMIDTNNEWIVQRTGIKERRIAQKEEFTSDLCVKAVEDLIENSYRSIDDVDMIIVSTITPDYHMPSVAAYLQAKLGIRNTGAIDLNAACAGFTYGLHMANSLITSGLHKKVLVIGGETMSKITDYDDRTTCILFGDGAGAVLVEYDEKQPSFLSAHLGTNGEAGDNLYCTNLSDRFNEKELVNTRFLVQNGRQVYKWVVTTIPQGMKKVIEPSGMDLNEVDWFVPHSANLRIIESICDKSDFSLDRTLYSLEDYGNTSSASIPLALNKAVREGKIKSGDKILLYGFGGGLTHCGLLIEWNI
jgi:3-oxoacyl-[acyl-carrier-protein] synthase III